MELTEIRKKLKKDLDKDRYEHTMGVMYTAACLAMAHEADIQKAMLAGLLHDCAKCLPFDESVDLCQQNHVMVSEVEYANPRLIHSKAGAVLAEIKYDVHDPAVLHAIKVHTTGAPNMTTLDKIIFIADYIEPKRDRAPELDYVRKLAFESLDVCLAKILYDTIHFLKGKRGVIDPATELTFEFYKQYMPE